ncbi:LytR C-terminal domain-containing protein [Cellulomonas sp. SLBN-39]|uniref:LytR C-terminal domain-containing protein n=1 Tax=Cellulomonas sp. SLBN-39 TaxID=2768446 RepID=UPI0011530DE8|nr:LytR C-terminal domain-containing protein [Cellulomonas sp. SLBN-39]TQL01655.1 LytR cell envelope-related transcriptional attenuator [Cellulomonas sp. SLBN-39]
MSKADYPYPEDEFDVSSPDSPRGVHRAPRSAWSRWWPFLAVLVVVPALAFAAVSYLTAGGDSPIGGTDGAGGGASQTPAPTETAAQTEPPAEEVPAAPALDTPVQVLNGAGIEGLATRVTGQLNGVGFTSVTAGNASAPLPAASTIYIGSEDLRVTADLVATTLGVPTVEVNIGAAPAGIVLVLVTDPAAG